MEKEVTRQDKIDAYLLKQMSSSERNEFESQMRSDSDLGEQVRLQEMFVEEICDRESFNSLLHEHKVGIILRLQIYRIASLAAVFAGLLGFFIIQPTTTSNSSLFNSYSDVEPGRIEPIKVGDPLRGDEFIIPGLSNVDSENALEGFNLFKNNDFVKATLSFKRIEKIKESPEIMLYLAISQLKSGQNTKAIMNLEYLASLKGFKSAELSNYYLSLGYVKSGKILKARRLLRAIINNNGEYSVKASEMLSKIRWF